MERRVCVGRRGCGEVRVCEGVERRGDHYIVGLYIIHICMTILFEHMTFSSGHMNEISCK